MFRGPVCFWGALSPLPLPPRSPLSCQSCPATSRGARAAGTRISPATSNGSMARGRGRALTTPLARVRGCLLSRGPRAAQGTPQPPLPRAGTCPAHPKQPHACEASSAGAARRPPHLGPGCGCCSSGHPCSMSPPPWLSPTLRLLLGCGPLCAVEPRAAGAARHLPPAARHRPALPLLLVPPGRPADRYAAPWHPPGDAPARLRSPGDRGVPKGCRTAA